MVDKAVSLSKLNLEIDSFSVSVPRRCRGACARGCVLCPLAEKCLAQMATDGQGLHRIQAVVHEMPFCRSHNKGKRAPEDV